nr:C666 [uncultured bacterium]ART36904.1 D56 [uncultured bacterium]
MSKACALIVLLLAVIATPAQVERTTPASEAELAQISERGKNLAEYDVAAWHSSEAVLALQPVEGSVVRYIAKRTADGWTVAFGRLNERRDKFLISYEAIQGVTPKEFKAAKVEPVKEDTGFFLFAARAIDTSLADFKGEARPYNVAVLPAPSNQFYVYVIPAQTKNGVFPLGGDARYLTSGDGLKIIEKRQMHKAIVEFTTQENVQAGFHTAVLDQIPEDTDVFHVLTRKPSVPQWIATKLFVYRVETDGTIRYLMTMEAFQKLSPPN